MTRPFELDDLYSLSFPSDPALSPDGSRIAFVLTRPDREADEDRSSIWLVGAEGGEPRQLTFGHSDGAPRWSPDGTTLAFVGRRGDDKAKPQVHLLPLEGGEARAVTDLPLGAGEPVWSPDGSLIAFAAVIDLDREPDASDATPKPVVAEKLDYKADGLGLIKGLRQHVFVVPAEGGDARQLTSGDFAASTPLWSPDGSELAFSASRTQDRDIDPAQAVYVVPVGGGEPRRLTPESGFFGVADWSPDGGTLLLAGRERLEIGHTRLFTMPIAGGEPTQLVTGYDRNVMVGQPAYPGARPRFLDAGERVLFCARDRGRVHLLSAPASGGAPTVLAGGDRIVAGASPEGGRIAFVAGTTGSPGEVFVVDESGERTVTELFTRALPDVELATPVERTFTAPDGTEIGGWILRSADATGRTPLLLDIHGGPHNAWGPAFDSVHLYHQTLVSRGWTVLYVNPRGSDGYGEEFWAATAKPGWGLSDEADFHAALDAVVEEGVADPERIAVSGYSYGGYMTCWLTARSDRFAAAVAGGCVSNLLSITGGSDLGWFIATIELGFLPYENQEALAELSPITHVGSVKTPTLIVHGENDLRCPVGQAEEWFTALRSQRVPAELVRYPGGGHLFILSGPPSHRIDFNRRVQEWVTRYAQDRAAAPAAPPLRSRVRGLQSRLETLIERHRVPAASVAVLADGDVVEAAAGVLNVETGMEATTDSVFQLGSIGKVWTATAVMQLVDEGLLDLDAPIVSVLPEFKVADADVTERVTMRHLLSHTSGIDGDHFPDTGRGDDCLERYVETCAELGQAHPIGATMSYCNAGYVIAGRVIEKLTGKVWDAAMKERLFDPLGLTNAVTLADEAIRFRTAFGHLVEPGEAPKLAPVWQLPRSTGPAGSICSTAAELLTFVRMHLDDGRTADGKQLLSPGSVKAMQEAQIAVPDPYTLGSHWGLGWILFDWDGRRLIGHDGNTIGQSAFLRILPERGVAIALLTNGGNAHDLYEDLYRELLGDLAGVHVPDRPEPLADPPPLVASRYTGTYARASVRIEIEARDRELAVTTTVLGPIAKLMPKPTEEYRFLQAGPDLFVARPEGTATWTPAVFFDLEDGTRCLHFGARATPRVDATEAPADG
jgi:dipeptidyl aminopeptidase/acylaminoacyl peptidase/CubicO group peptidase (beta-lactamase class C family)